MNDNTKKNKSIEPVYFVMIGFIVLIISGIMGSVISNIILIKISILLIVASGISIIGGIIGIVVEDKNVKRKVVENKNEFQQEYDAYINKRGIVESNLKVTLIEMNEYEFHSNIPHYLWVDNGKLNLFPMSTYYRECCTTVDHKPDMSMLRLKSIPIDSILYFEEIGELRRYTKVSGGGSSLKGALLGYALADDVGAIIGSRKPIKSETITEDERKIELIYKNPKNEVENLEFTHDAYEALKQLMPSKELRRIINLTKSRQEKPELLEKTTAKDKLKQLQDFKEEGLITEEEFSEQKKKILNSL